MVLARATQQELKECPHVLWEEYTWEEINRCSALDPVVVIPTGSIEQHGQHLPLITDAAISHEIALRSVEKVRNKISVLLGPLMPLGCSGHHMEFPGTLSLPDCTYMDVMTHVGLCIVRHGFRRLFFLNGHGGNMAPLQLVINRIRQESNKEVYCAAANYWSFLKEDVSGSRKSQMNGIAHAGEFETGMMKILMPALVKGILPKSNFSCSPDGYWAADWYSSPSVQIAFTLKDISKTGVLGDPSSASKKFAQKMLNTAIENIAQFLISFSYWNFEEFSNTQHPEPMV